jgi:hypothetical protein
MIKSIIALFSIVAIIAAQNPQTGPLSVTTITPGQYVAAALPLYTAANAYHLTLYKMWIPENTSTVSIYVNNTYPTTSDYCYELNIYISNRGYLPCSTYEFSDDNDICARASYGYIDNEEDETVIIIDPSALDYDDYTFTWGVNQWWYFGIGREDSDDNSTACTYTFQAFINSSCTQGSIGQPLNLEENDENEIQCSPAYTYQNTSSASYTFSSTTSPQVVYEVMVPSPNVGNIWIQVNSTYDDLYIIGANYASPTYDESACGVSDYTSESGGIYMYNLYCYTPKAGSFFIVIYNDDDAATSINGTAKITYMDCNSTYTGMGGFNCSFPVVPCNSTWNNYQVYIPYPATQEDEWLNGVFWYCYIDVSASSNTWDVNVGVPTGYNTNYDYLMITRKNGFSEYDSYYGYDTDSEASSYEFDEVDNHVFQISAFDTYESGRFYIGLLCYYDGDNGANGGCNFTISANTTAAPAAVTTGASGSSTASTSTHMTSTTASTTTNHATSTMSTMMPTMAMTSGGKTSSALIVLPSLFLVCSSLFALLF